MRDELESIKPFGKNHT